MKTVKITLCIAVMLAFSGLTESFGQWAPNGTSIYNTNTGNVGIGNNAPTTLLHVKKNMTEPTITVQNLGGVGGAAYSMIDNASGANWKFKATLTGGFKIRDNAFALDVMTFEANSAANALYIDEYGDVGMGLTEPDYYGLHVINYTSGRAAVVGQDQSGAIYASGMLGVLEPSFLGAPIPVINAGVLGIKPNAGASGAAVYGWNNDDNSDNYAGIFATDGAPASGTNYGAYATAKHAANNFAGKFIGRVEVTGHPNTTEAPDYLSTVLKSTVTHTVSNDTRAVDGVSIPVEGYGIGVYGTGGWMGVRGLCPAGAYSASAYGVYGEATGTAGTRIGVFGTASGGSINWAGYFSGDAYISSDLRIATTTQATGYALSVNGKIACEEVLVEDMVSWPDYVFADDYKLMSLEELELSIQTNNHLPGLPSADEIEENGLMIGDMQKLMMEKIEELTLYTIEQNKKMNELLLKMENLEKENTELRQSINK